MFLITHKVLFSPLRFFLVETYSIKDLVSKITRSGLFVTQQFLECYLYILSCLLISIASTYSTIMIKNMSKPWQKFCLPIVSALNDERGGNPLAMWKQAHQHVILNTSIGHWTRLSEALSTDTDGEKKNMKERVFCIMIVSSPSTVRIFLKMCLRD